MIREGLHLGIEALNALRAHVAVLDVSGTVVLVNHAWSRFAQDNGGVPGGESYLGVNYLTVCRDAMLRGDETAGLALSGLDAVLRGDREEFSLEYPCHSAHRERWFRMSATGFATGAERYLVVVHDDITAQMQHYRALQESEALLRSVLEALPVGVWIMSADGRIVEGNAAGRRIWGGARYVDLPEFGQYKGRWLSTGQPIAAEEWAAARAIRRGETSIDEEVEIECFDGTRKIILNSAIPLRGGDGRLTGAIIVNQDITGRKHAEAEREGMLVEQDRLRMAAQEANRLKDEFIARLSHELRTPLQSVIGWMAMLRRAQPDSPIHERAAAAIERNTRVLAQLLDDTLDMSRVVHGQLTLEPADVDLSALAADIVENIRPEAIAKRIALVESAEGGEATVHGDPVRLQQIVWNLLANALKFTPAGGRIDVSIHAGADWVEVRVRDSGIGIRPEFLPSVFDRFRSSRDAAPASRTGLGLGLAIVKELVERHHGTISAESGGEGQGATFTVRLPAARRHPDRATRQPPP